MTEIFKTPGKLRGKTPYTARKRNPDEARVPLSNLFSTANQSLKSPSKFSKSPEKPFSSRIANVPAESVSPRKLVDEQPQAQIQSAVEIPIDTAPEKPISYPELTTADIKGKQPIRDLPPNKALNSFSTYNTDSGYHGLGDDDDELVLPSTQPLPETQVSTTADIQAPSMLSLDTGMGNRKSLSVDRRTTEGSFVSAQENLVSRGQTVEPMDTEEDQPDKADEDTPRPLVKSAHVPSASPEKPQDKQVVSPVKDDVLDKDGDVMIDDNFDDIGSPSDGSTPTRPAMRKNSSFGFASLPPRDPLKTKKSMGARDSRTSHVDMIKSTALGRQSYFTGHMEGFKSASNNTATEKEELQQDNTRGKQLQQNETEQAYDTSVLHNKLNTQRLHDKISMLGGTRAPRTTKTAPLSQAAIPQAKYPELPDIKNTNTDTERVPILASSTQEDWIKPLSSPQRPAMTKSQTAAVMEQVADNETVGNLEKSKITRTETFHDLSDKSSRTPTKRSIFSALDQHKSVPAATPPSRRMESPVQPTSNKNAESTAPLTSPRRIDGTPKSRFHTIMQSAKSLFSSSAGLSAAAKLETLSSPSALRSEPNPQHVGTSPERYSPSPEKLPARSQVINELKGKQATKAIQLDDPFGAEERIRPATKAIGPSANIESQQKAQSKERDIPASSTRTNAKIAQPVQSQVRRDPGTATDSEPKFPLPPTLNHGQSQPARPRPVKPTREPTQKQKPQPVSIRLGSTITRMPISSVAPNSQESSAASAPVPAKQPTLPKQSSNSSLHTAPSNTSLKSSTSTQSQRRAQAAAAAEAKKQEEREAILRKEEQKKRAALLKQQQEEARRQERERSVAEENKKATQRQQAEQRGLENARQRQGSQPPKPANDLGSTFQQEKASHRTDVGPARPPSRLGSSMQAFNQSINQPPNNPAKPAKRPLDDEPQHRGQASVSQAKSRVVEPKRRKTEDEYNQQHYNQAAPLKQQPIRKENGKLSLLGHAYPQAPPPAAHHHTGSMYKTGPVPLGTAGQPLKHAAPMDMAQYTSGRIPFAPAHAAPSGTAHKTPSHKTPKPGPSAQRVPAKPSPQYPPSESIHLPEPPTDSEEEDSDADMIPAPNWAQGEELHAALTSQEAWDPDRIFGAIPDFSLEEAFKNDKKIKKFRERTSSANWGGPDGLTQEEINRDLAARRVMRANGGWSFNLS
ncbi:hypothetical protein EIK77_003370 [Talaromyces pinophilus]|nr:hypothetical protein EIK77_003370 [Talaromyces pinophilus]